MSLIQCPECQNEISDQCSSCTKCGYPIQSNLKGFVGSTEPAPNEQDFKRGAQRAQGRYEIGEAIALIGIIIAVILGVATGSWLVGLGITFVALAIGAYVQYS